MILKFIKQIVNALKGSSEIDIYTKNTADNTPLIEAASRNDIDMVTALLKAGADTNVTGLVGIIALSEAAARNNTKMISLLLNNGAIINGIGNDYFYKSPLCEAARKNAVEAAQLLIENGADLDYLNDAGRTPLMIAAEYNSLDVADLLIRSGANLEVKEASYPYNRTALCFAVIAAHEEITDLLIKNNAKVKAINQVKKSIPPGMRKWLRAKGFLK